jgi:hypothetical protein
LLISAGICDLCFLVDLIKNIEFIINSKFKEYFNAFW